MPLFQPTRHSTHLYKVETLTKDKCPACPDVWFSVEFGTEFNGEVQGAWIRMPKGQWLWSDAPLDELQATFGADHVYEVGRDGYYLTMEQAREAIAAGVHGVHYVDDYSDEYQNYYVCKDDDEHTPFAEAHVAEPIR